MAIAICSLLGVGGSDRSAALAGATGERRDALDGALRGLGELPRHAIASTPATDLSSDTSEERAGSELVYSNTSAVFVLRPGAFRYIADDLYTIRGCGCNLDGYEFTVNGGGTGSGAGVTVEDALL